MLCESVDENGIQIKPYKLAEDVDLWDDNALAETVSV